MSGCNWPFASIFLSQARVGPWTPSKGNPFAMLGGFTKKACVESCRFLQEFTTGDHKWSRRLLRAAGVGQEETVDLPAVRFFEPATGRLDGSAVKLTGFVPRCYKG